jgi:eukaryotic-like serine/threonine-protein kinase
MEASSTLRVRLPARYRPLRHLANGGMGAVWAAEDTILGRTVAIKLLAAQFADDGRAVRRFQREARAAATLSAHPHVVTIYDVGEHDGLPFIVMEHMAGGSMADVLREGPPARVDATRWLAEAAAALDAAHARGIVHRDVKPGNLLLDERRRLAVADFGIARVAQEADLTLTGEVLGSAPYLSPEQAAGRSTSPASDRYALAVVAYELLTGARPFAGAGAAALAHAHATQPPPRASDRIPDLPPAADDALVRGLAKDPDDRWPRATALSGALATALDASDATAATRPLDRDAPTRRLAPAGVPGAPAPFRLPPPRRAGGPPRRALLAVVALGALALGGALASAAGTTTVDPRVSVAHVASSAPATTQAEPPPTTTQPPPAAVAPPDEHPAAKPDHGPGKDGKPGKHDKHGGDGGGD